jgi:hypothetical protein
MKMAISQQSYRCSRQLEQLYIHENARHIPLPTNKWGQIMSFLSMVATLGFILCIWQIMKD